MKDDGWQHIFIYATFVWPPRWNDDLPYINIHEKFDSVSKCGSGDTDEKS